MLRSRVLAPLLAALAVLLLVLAGCGSDGGTAEKKTGDKPSPSAKPPASEAPDADGLKKVAVDGISLKVPAAWKFKDSTDDDTGGGLYFWLNPGKGERDGLVAVSTTNSTQSVDEAVAFDMSKRGTLYQQVTKKTPVQVEGMGKGYRLHVDYKGGQSDRLVVATIDGLLVEVIYVADPKAKPPRLPRPDPVQREEAAVSRRTTAAAGLATAALLLTACGGGATEEEPKAEPNRPQVATDIAPPKPTSVQSFAGQGLGYAYTEHLTTTMTTALQTGDKKAFLSGFDPRDTELVAQQGTWFDNVRKVPMKLREMVLVKATDNRDSTGKGTLAADMGFQHQITGADSAPLAEWYRYTFKQVRVAPLRHRREGCARGQVDGREVLALLPPALGRPRDERRRGPQVDHPRAEGRQCLPAQPRRHRRRRDRGPAAALRTRQGRARPVTCARASGSSCSSPRRSPTSSTTSAVGSSRRRPTSSRFASQVFLSDPKTGFVDSDLRGDTGAASCSAAKLARQPRRRPRRCGTR